MSLAAFQQLVDDLVRDKDQVIASGSRDAALQAAIARYSIDAPRSVVEDVTSAGGQIVPLPQAWAHDWSALQQIEFPIGTIPPSLINTNSCLVYRGPAGDELRSLFTQLAGDVLRLTYTAPHELTGLVDTVPEKHHHAVASLAAADLCGQLASHYATEGSPTIGADTTDHQSKSERFSRRARDLRAAYTAVVGAAPSQRNRPASVSVPIETRDALGQPRIFHPVRDWPRS